MKDEHNQEHDHLSQKEPESYQKACACKEQQGEEKQEARSRKILSLNIKKCTKNT